MRANLPRRADARQSKKDTRKASAGFIPCVRAPEQERAAPRTSNRLRQFNASLAQ
jgi:hypothetical protein